MDRSTLNTKSTPKPAGTKSELVLALLRQTGGATLRALMAATGWQAHTVRGFVSGQLTKKMCLKVRSFKRDGERVYSIRSASERPPRRLRGIQPR